MSVPRPKPPLLPRLIAGAFVVGFLLWAAFIAWYVLQERHRHRLREHSCLRRLPVALSRPLSAHAPLGYGRGRTEGPSPWPARPPLDSHWPRRSHG